MAGRGGQTKVRRPTDGSRPLSLHLQRLKVTNSRRVLAARLGRLAATETCKSKTWPIGSACHAAPCSPSPTQPMTSRFGLGRRRFPGWALQVGFCHPPQHKYPSRLASLAQAIELINRSALKIYSCTSKRFFFPTTGTESVKL